MVFQCCKPMLSESTDFWHDLSIIAHGEKGATETTVAGELGIMMATCLRDPFSMCISFVGSMFLPGQKLLPHLLVEGGVLHDYGCVEMTQDNKPSHLISP